MSVYAASRFGRLAATALALAPLLAATPADAQRATPVVNTVKRIPFSCFSTGVANGQSLAANCFRVDESGSVTFNGFPTRTSFSSAPAGYTMVVTDVGVDPSVGDSSPVVVNFGVEFTANGGTLSLPTVHVGSSDGPSYRATSSNVLFSTPSGGSVRINNLSTNRKNIFLSGYLVRNEEVGL